MVKNRMRILIVDDELLVRTNLKYILTVGINQYTEKREVTVCVEASNGEEALTAIEKYHPDVIFSDMMMPVMDGMELCRQCHEKYPEIKFIALSNFDDFEYVRGTLLNGAIDYILKHTLDAKRIYDVLVKVYDEKQRSNQEGYSGEKNLDILKQDFIVNLLSGVYLSEKQIKKTFSALNISLAMKRVLPVLMWISEYRNTTLEENNILSFSIGNIISEIMNEQENGEVCHLEEGKYTLIFSFENIRSEQRLRESIQYSLNRIRICMKNFLQLKVYFIVGNLLDSIEDIALEYKKIEQQWNKIFYTKEDIWLLYEQSGETRIADFYEETFSVGNKELYLALKDKDRVRTTEIVNTFFEKMEVAKPTEVVLKMLVSDLLLQIRQAAEAYGIQMNKISQSTWKEEEIMEMKSFHNMRKAIEDFLLVVLDFIEENNLELSLHMKKSIQFISENYSRNLSQSDVAEYVGISNAYLSVLFKNELKESFPMYLMKFRMEKVRKYLDSGKHNLKEISAECGFGDYVYFLKCFKKIYKCTPKEYVTKHKKV